MKETGKKINDIEVLSQEELSEVITTGKEAFGQLYDTAMIGTMNLGKIRIRGVRWTDVSQKIYGYGDEGLYEKNELEITFATHVPHARELPDEGSFFRIGRLTQNNKTAWSVNVSHSQHDKNFHMDYTVNQTTEGASAKGEQASYKLNFDKAQEKPDISRYQKDLQTLKAINDIAAKASKLPY
jgi:hypothetical protein